MDVQTVTVVITGISIIIGVILSLNARKQELETRQAQLFMQIYNRWTAKDMVAAYGLSRFKYTWETTEEAFQKYIYDFDVDVFSNLQIMHNFYEGLGMLVKRGLIDVSMVEDLFSRRILWHWERHKPAFQRAREELDDPTQYDSFEYLYNLIKRRQQSGIVGT